MHVAFRKAIGHLDAHHLYIFKYENHQRYTAKITWVEDPGYSFPEPQVILKGGAAEMLYQEISMEMRLPMQADKSEMKEALNAHIKSLEKTMTFQFDLVHRFLENKK